ncbi:MAG TPA: hypothetical protein P5531_06405 [Bacteroidales bacterium]|nr:hypothetical protein [Bacteroidales bacterium]HSA43732.1 hypothetical protein [Bacteroidales bacterium]
MDRSRELLNKYISLVDKRIEVVLLKGEVIRGMITAFISSETGGGGTGILKWRIAEVEEASLLGTDPFGFDIGRTIDHKAIAEVRFMEDQTIMKFNDR